MQVILGNCPSKSNCYKVGSINGHGTLIKTSALSKYEKSFYLQCNQYRNNRIVGFFELSLRVFYPSNRSDLDNSLKVILDCLQKVGAIENDNKCVRIHAEKFIDKKEPRIEFELKEV